MLHWLIMEDQCQSSQQDDYMPSRHSHSLVSIHFSWEDRGCKNWARCKLEPVWKRSDPICVNFDMLQYILAMKLNSGLLAETKHAFKITQRWRNPFIFILKRMNIVNHWTNYKANSSWSYTWHFHQISYTISKSTRSDRV